MSGPKTGDTSGVKEVPNNIGENTQSFTMRYDSKDIYFTVSKNNWSDRPRGTIMMYTGAYEDSNMMKTQIEMFTDKGFDVVTVDMPGEGQSYRHQEVGGLNLNHMISYDERVEAVQKVQQYYEDNFDRGHDTQFHAVTTGNGNVDFFKTLRAGQAGANLSVAMLGPHLESDITPDAPLLPVWKLDGLDSVPFSSFAADPNGLLDSQSEIENFIGSNLFEQFSAAHDGKDLPAATKGYVSNYLKGVEDIKDNPSPYANAITRNNIRTLVVYDGQNSSNPNVGKLQDEDEIAAWFRGNKIDAHLVNYEGAGPDIFYNSHNVKGVVGLIIENIEHSSPRARVIGWLNDIDEHEWNSCLTHKEQVDMQRTLEEKGFSVGPTGFDGTIDFASISHTQHALADFIMEAEAQGKVDLSTVDIDSFNPTEVYEFVKNTELGAASLDPVPNAPSMKAFSVTN